VENYNHGKLQDQRIIVIEGASGVGKTTIAINIALEYQYTYLGCGLVYRSVAYASQGVLIEDRLINIVKNLQLGFKVSYTSDGPQHHVFINDYDVTMALQSEDVAYNASLISLMPNINALILGKIKKMMSTSSSCVLEGRQIANILAPNSHYVFYLTASPEIRALRRSIQNQLPYLTCYCDIISRDQRDNDSLKPSDGAYILDTTLLSIQDVISYIKSYI
jgi:cytidylate kinase